MKTSTLGILATATLFFAPVAAHAQNGQVNVQKNTNSATTVGAGNGLWQDAEQKSTQNQFDLDAYSVYTPATQLSVQDNSNGATGIGSKNLVEQNTDRDNAQAQFGVGVEHYIPATPERGYNFNY